MSGQKDKIRKFKEIEEKLATKRGDFDDVMKNIRPFIIPSERLKDSTSGNWIDGTSVIDLERLSIKSKSINKNC